MGWLSDYRTTIIEAFTLRRVIALPLVIATVTAVVHASTALSKQFARGETLLGAPSWAWGLIAGLLLFLYFMIACANRLRLQLEPKINVSFNPNGEGMVTTPTEIYKDGKLFAHDEAVYIGITLQALSRTTVKNCVAFVTGIEKRRISNDHFIEIPVHGPLNLTPTPIDVHPRIPMPIAFLKAGQFDNKLGFTVDGLPLRLRDTFDEQGTYRFTINVNGEGITETIRVEVDWTGKWDGITARQV
jgi:hypothetical protein